MPGENILNEVIGRLRINESKITTLRERLLVTDSNMVEEYKNISQEIKDINTGMRELKKEIQSIKETTQDIIKSIENLAPIQDVQVLEKYINVWSPLNFVTEKEVKQIINENA
jgi:uncharacterized protein YoxC